MVVDSVLGTLVASIQSSIGNVVSPSIFATLQSAGAGGYGLPIVQYAVQAAGGAILAAVGVLSGIKK